MNLGTAREPVSEPGLRNRCLVGGTLEPEFAVDTLQPFLSSEDAHVRVLAAGILLQSHCLMRQCMTILRGYLDADDTLLVSRAATALGRAGGTADEVIPRLKMLKERTDSTGDAAAHALRRINAAMGG